MSVGSFFYFCTQLFQVLLLSFHVCVIQLLPLLYRPWMELSMWCLEHWLHLSGIVLGIILTFNSSVVWLFGDRDADFCELLTDAFVFVYCFVGWGIVSDAWELGALSHDGKGLRPASSSYAETSRVWCLNIYDYLLLHHAHSYVGLTLVISVDMVTSMSNEVGWIGPKVPPPEIVSKQSLSFSDCR